MRTLFNFIRLAAVTGLAACGGGDDGGGGPENLDDARPAIAAYATNVHQNYVDSVAGATALKTAVTTFITTPTMENQVAAQTAWLESRNPYELTEGYRFYDGPIDDPDTGVEGLLNSWPLDEGYIDYMDMMPGIGLVNNDAFAITTQSIVDKNAADGEDRITTGYHAVEFLLWGQDLSDTGPGARPFTDYSTEGHATRRGLYLQTATDLIVTNLQQVTDAWADSGENYRTAFVAADPADSLKKILLGMGSLAGAELSGERISTALDNQDQEDEHSCFSDNTNVDLKLGAQSIENIYLGTYGTTNGAGLDDVVEARNPTLNAKMKTQLAKTKADILTASTMRFDQAIHMEDQIALWRTVVDDLLAETDTIIEIGDALGITINVE